MYLASDEWGHDILLPMMRCLSDTKLLDRCGICYATDSISTDKDDEDTLYLLGVFVRIVAAAIAEFHEFVLQPRSQPWKSIILVASDNKELKKRVLREMKKEWKLVLDLEAQRIFNLI